MIIKCRFTYFLPDNIVIHIDNNLFPNCHNRVIMCILFGLFSSIVTPSIWLCSQSNMAWYSFCLRNNDRVLILYKDSWSSVHLAVHISYKDFTVVILHKDLTVLISYKDFTVLISYKDFTVPISYKDFTISISCRGFTVLISRKDFKIYVTH